MREWVREGGEGGWGLEREGSDGVRERGRERGGRGGGLLRNHLARRRFSPLTYHSL